MSELKDIEIINYIIKIFLIAVCTICTSIKITNTNQYNKLKILISILLILIISIMCGKIKEITNSSYSIICLILLLSIINCKLMKSTIGYAILITMISFSINYILFFLAVLISFIPNIIIKISEEYLSLLLIMIIYLVLLLLLFKIKRFKHGIIILQKNKQNGYFNILILNISMVIVFTVIILSYYERDFTLNLIFGFIMFSAIMFITIQKSLQLYYKQKLLIQDLNETKEELEKKKQEVEQLEKENLSFSKKSHTLAHKQRSLEYKINELMLKSEISEATDIKDRINNISKELYNKTATVELTKTEVEEIDDMLKYMQSECNKSSIDFNVQIKGNIHHMVNNIINKEDLETLLADHIKNAIIAINHSDNVNKSILVKLGKIDKIYSLYIYDSGIEFEKETLSNLGNKPSTTHAEEGGTGMGFMNTFDTLRKYNASMAIKEYNKPNKDNYTKSLIIKFDKKAEFKITSYRQNEIDVSAVKIIDKFTTSDIIVENNNKKQEKQEVKMTELWDIYDINKQKIGKLAQRGEYEFKKGEYHIVVTAIIINSENKILISKRAESKKTHPLKWECNGGSVLAGETSVQGIIREIKEELGIELLEKEAIFLKDIRRDKTPPDFKEFWLFKKDMNIQDIKFTDGESTEAKWVTIDEFIQMKNNDEIVKTIEFGEEEYKKALELLKREYEKSSLKN